MGLKKIKEFYKTQEWFQHLTNILLLIAFLFSFQLYNIVYDAIVLKWGVYTVGEYQNISYKKRQKYYFETVYSYKDKDYLIVGSSYLLKERNNGEKVVIQLLPNFPKVKRMLEYYYVPRNFEAPPANGWKELPPGIQKVGEHKWFPEFVKVR